MSCRANFPRSRCDFGLLRVVLLAAAATTVACGDEAGDVARAVAAESKSFAGGGPVVRAPSQQGDARNAPILVIDASKSMQGYVGCAAGARTDFLQAADAIVARLAIEKAFLFGAMPRSAAELTPVPPARGTGCSQLYTRDANPDAELVAFAQKDSGLLPLVYLTDGVQSAADAASPSPVIRAFGGWVSDGRGLGLVAFRGRFNGTFWSEEAGKLLGSVNVPDRPFYAFVLARTSVEADAIVERISSMPSVVGAFRLNALPAACSIENRPTGRVARGDNPPWQLLGPAATNELLGGPAHIATVRCPVPKNFALRSMQAKVQHSYRSWRGQSFVDANPQGTVEFTTGIAARADTTLSIPLTGRITRDPQTLFGLYHLVITPTPGGFVPIIDSLSTEHDSDTMSARQTYRLSWLLDGIVRARFATGNLQLRYTTAFHYPEK